jgi:hypothetical protein
MRDRAQYAIRSAALERVRDDFEVLLIEADLVLEGWRNPVSRANSDELGWLQVSDWWTRYRQALAQNIKACDEWAEELRTGAAIAPRRQ